VLYYTAKNNAATPAVLWLGQASCRRWTRDTCRQEKRGCKRLRCWVCTKRQPRDRVLREGALSSVPPISSWREEWDSRQPGHGFLVIPLLQTRRWPSPRTCWEAMSRPRCQPAKRSLEERVVLSLASLSSCYILNTSDLPALNFRRWSMPSGQILTQ